MIFINKNEEPKSLTEYRNQPGAVWDGENFTPIKDQIRLSLLREQRFLCCYCMSRIDEDTMKIEHWHSQ